MIIADSHVVSVAADKFKNNSPLVVDADRPLAVFGRIEQFEPVSGERAKIFDLRGEVNAVQLRQGSLLNILRQAAGTRFVENLFRFLIGERFNHNEYYLDAIVSRQVIIFSMKIICLTYTFPRDAERAAYHQKFLPADWRKIWCVESAHEAKMRAAAPAGTELLVADFPRGSSLRHAEAIEGMRRVFLALATECDLLVKLDSDTALFRPEAWTAPFASADIDYTYIRRHTAESRLLANGCAYAVSGRALRRLDAFDAATHARAQFRGHEDLVFSAFWTGATAPKNRDLTLCQLDKKKIWWKIKPCAAPDCFGGHFGYVSFERDREVCERFFATRRQSHGRTPPSACAHTPSP